MNTEPTSRIMTEITPEQETLFPAYLDPWRAIALKPGLFARQKATEAIKTGYDLFCLKTPKIVFFKNCEHSN